MSLRRGVFAVLLVAFGWALWYAVASNFCPGWLAPILWLGALVIVFLFERQRYSPVLTADTAQWNATGEKFIDPVSGERLQVFVDPKSGERDYRPLT